MFTGLVQEVGEIRASSRVVRRAAPTPRLVMGFRDDRTSRLSLGASICVDGVCLTVAALDSDSFAADVSGETLRVTTLGARKAGSRVNLEPSLRAGDSLGGHWVSGHVDGVAEVLHTARDARSLAVTLAAPAPLARYIARKGSVTLDGVSLTVNAVDGANFSINLIPHTLEVTTLGALAPGVRLNLEIDLLARYVERLDDQYMKPLNSIEEILADIAAGRMVVIMDDEDRENEGDLIMAAQNVRPEDVNFMARFGRGLICLTLTAERCRQLRLPLMVSETHREHRTNFTLSIEAAEGVTTGISAHDRAHTIITAVRAECASRRPAPARSHLSRDGAARRRADPRRPHRGGLRSRATRRARSLRGHRRDHERRRHHGAAARISRSSPSSTSSRSAPLPT